MQLIKITLNRHKAFNLALSYLFCWDPLVYLHPKTFKIIRFSNHLIMNISDYSREMYFTYLVRYLRFN